MKFFHKTTPISPVSEPSLDCSSLRAQFESLKRKQSLFHETLAKAVEEDTSLDGLFAMKQEIGLERKALESALLPAMTREAREIMQKDFFGPEAIQKAFGFTPENIPLIPFSRETLERAKELDQYLILRVKETSDGTPLTIITMNALCKGKVNDGSKLLYSDDGSGVLKNDTWYKDEDFTKESPQLSWALVDKESIPDTLNKNYLNQTEAIVAYLENEVFKGATMPEDFQSAIDAFKRDKSAIEELLVTDWQKAAEKLEGLAITKLTRHTPAEVFYDMIVCFQNNGERILERSYAWTSKRDSDGYFVDVGDFASDGADVDWDDPRDSDGNLGVSFSRRN